MDEINHIYVVLPILSFVSTISLAVIALLKRKNSRVNIWFAATAFWWALIPLIFIIHHLTDDLDLLLQAERIVEFFFVFGVPLQVVLFHRLCNTRKIRLEILLTVISMLFSLTAFSEYCITGIRKYNWGYIAYGGLTFNLFALYALIGIIYGIVFIYRQYKIQTNEIIRIRIKYIMSSYIAMNLLTLMNMPAINGINIYPPGNFCFVPLMIIGYSLLKYRLLDINQFLLKSIIWIIAIFSVIIPIAAVSWIVLRNSENMNILLLSASLTALFSLLLLYFRYILPLVSEKIQKQSYDFRRSINDLNSKIVQVKSVKDLVQLISTMIESKVFASSVSLLLKDFNDNKFRLYNADNYNLQEDVEIDFYHAPVVPELLEKDQVEVNPVYSKDRVKFLELFRKVNAEIIIPIVFDGSFIGSINIGRKREGNYKRIEIRFLEQMVNSINIAFSNSLLLNRIEELNLSLENKVEERTCQLQEANKKLRELDRLKSNFFANISHEIRTPLTLILAPVESVLQGDNDDAPERGFFENLQRNAIILLKLINDLLDFSRIEAGQMKMKIREVDMVSFIKSYVSSFSSAAESKGIKFIFEYPDSTVPVFIDTEKMDKILMNLFSNALKFTDKGGFIKIIISNSGGRCSVRFEDSGIGIPADKKETIFDRFSQVDSGSTRKYEGTGIGLALVKEFVELHGGSIDVESRTVNDFPEDHGTVFTVYLPEGDEHFRNNANVICLNPCDLEIAGEFQSSFNTWDTAEFSQWRTQEIQVTRSTGSCNPHILIVEDNKDMRNLLGSILNDQYNVHYAVNGEDGYALARRLKPDLIVSDVMMPVMNGYDMTQKIKSDPGLVRVPVILLTAKAEITNKIEGLEFGADDYLTKPFSSRELLTRIKSLLKTRNYELALEQRNREIEDDLKTARLIQIKLLPQVIPEVDGYSFYPLYIPMDEVGGDFYDYNVRSRYIEIFISDVSGHGLVSAFLSLIAKMALDSISQRDSCAWVLQILNKMLCKSTVNTNYMTAFFCLIDRETDKMIYSNAGHMPPIVYRDSSGSFFELRTGGKPLGLFEDLIHSEDEFQLEPGDRVLFYTDGIIECMNLNNDLYGERKFRDFISSNRAVEPEKLCTMLIDELKKFCGREKFGDDLCLLVFDVK